VKTIRLGRRARRQMLARLVSLNGLPLDVGQAGRCLGVTPSLVTTLLRRLQRAGAVRLVPCLDGSRRPLLYLLDAAGADAASWRALCTEEVMARVAACWPGARFAWWKPGRLRQVDLVAWRGALRIGFRFSRLPPSRSSDRAPLEAGLRDGVIHAGLLLHAGKEWYRAGRGILAAPLQVFLRAPEEWVRRATPPPSPDGLSLWRLSRSPRS
jgi:DNA-binding MarR family transcriptional regulator